MTAKRFIISGKRTAMTAKMVKIHANSPKGEGRRVVMDRESFGETIPKADLTGQKEGGTAFNVL
jgi:hypothetical protein